MKGLRLNALSSLKKTIEIYILQLSDGKLVLIEAQDAIILEFKIMRVFNQYVTFLPCDYVLHFENDTEAEVTKTTQTVACLLNFRKSKLNSKILVWLNR